MHDIPWPNFVWTFAHPELRFFVVFRAECELSLHSVYSNPPYLLQIYVLLLSSGAMQSLTAGQTLEISKDNGRRCLWHRTDDVGVNFRALCDASVPTALKVQTTKIHSHDDIRQPVPKFPGFQGPRQNAAVCTTPHRGTKRSTSPSPIWILNKWTLKCAKKFVVGDQSWTFMYNLGKSRSSNGWRSSAGRHPGSRDSTSTRVGRKCLR